MTDEQKKAFEDAWENLRAPINQTITSKWYFLQGWQAAQSQPIEVLVPKKKMADSSIMTAEDMNDAWAFNDCLDEVRRLNSGNPRIVFKEGEG